MNQNRNMLLFFVLSMAFIGVYMFTMGRLHPASKNPASQIQVESPAPAPETAPAASPALQEASPLPPSNPEALFHLESEALALTWRKGDGALVQIVWRRDGTRFFPEPDGKTGAGTFPGLGGSPTSLFAGDPQVLSVPGGRRVVFGNGAGAALTYFVPDAGHALEVESSQVPALLLLRKPAELAPVQGLGRVYTLEEKRIHVVTWTDMLKDPFFSFLGSKRKLLPPAAPRLGLDAGVQPGVASQRTHYFAAIWNVTGGTVAGGAVQPGYQALPGSDGHIRAQLYLGPKKAEELARFHPQGQPQLGKPFLQVVDFGFFGSVAQVLFLILRGIHGFIPNWGWAIVVFSLLIRLALWPLNTKTTVSQLRMKELEPQQKAIQSKYEKFGSDMAKKQEMQKEMMAFYKKNGHNPMGGCLPMLIQMPVFFALWSMLNAVFELHGASFLWMHDLSAKDPFYVLPVLMGGSMVAQQLMTPAIGDPAQRRMMMVIMPVMMTVMFSNFASGLNLYYLMFNLLGLVQTWWVTRTYQPQPVKV